MNAVETQEAVAGLMYPSKRLLAEARRRYANAKKRARFWSGTPSFGGNRASVSRKVDEMYDLAMCDCDSWERELEKLTGRRPPHYDPRKKFNTAFVRGLGKCTANNRVDGNEPS